MKANPIHLIKAPDYPSCANMEGECFKYPYPHTPEVSIFDNNKNRTSAQFACKRQSDGSYAIEQTSTDTPAPYYAPLAQGSACSACEGGLISWLEIEYQSDLKIRLEGIFCGIDYKIQVAFAKSEYFITWDDGIAVWHKNLISVDVKEFIVNLAKEDLTPLCGAFYYEGDLSNFVNLSISAGAGESVNFFYNLACEIPESPKYPNITPLCGGV